MRRRWLIGVVGLVVTCGLAGTVISSPRFQKWYNPPVLVIPEDDEVAELRASLRGIPTWDIPEVPEFVVPRDHIPSILYWVRPTRYDREAAISPRQSEWGQLRIRDTHGREVSVRFYEMGMNPTVFTPDGIDYFWGGWYGINERGEQAKFVAAIFLLKEILKASPNHKR